jgi:hypothetical protein
MAFRHRLDAIIFFLTDPIQSQFKVIFIVVIIVIESTQQTIFLSPLRGSNQ